MNNENLIAVSTCTAGFNHINRTKKDDVIVTHTPGVLHETVADYTIAIIMANLRNLIDLHSKVWNGLWTSEDKWDLDQELSSVITTKKVGIIGLGEIGSQVVRKLYHWGIKIAYYDHNRKEEFEKLFPNLQFRKTMEEIFRDCDIISLHIPLNNQTRHIIDRHYLQLMKKNSLLINTARGAIINLEDLLNLLEEKEIQINLSFDVFPEEPVDSEILGRFKKIKKEQPSRRFIFLPHNASADADTRGRMNILFLQDIIKIIESQNLEDLQEIHLIPQHETDLKIKNWRILKFWNI
jgi:lactate dehydrogenase-like 2-hydroxyacid dehydrogenase